MINQNGEEYTKDVVIPKIKIGYVGIVFDESKVYQVLKDGAGDKAGVKAGDVFISVNGINGDLSDLIRILKENPEQELKLLLKRDDNEIELTITPSAIMKRVLQVSFIEKKNLDFFHNLYYAWKETKYYLRANFIGISELISGKTENVEVQGIVGISEQISKTESIIEFFYLMSAISFSLGIMNLLPIPGLDGGKILITVIELIRRKPMKKETEVKITLIGFALLISLSIYVTIGDISNLFK